MVGICKVEGDVAAIFEITIAVEFASVVRGDCSEAIRMLRDEVAKAFVGRVHGSILKPSDQDITGLSIDDGSNTAFALSVYGVHFPMADLGAVLRFSWPLLNRSLPRKAASGVVLAVSLSSLFSCAAKVLMQRASRFLVLPDVAVDGLVTDGEVPMPSQPPRNLLWTVVLT